MINVPLRFKLKEVHRLGIEPRTPAWQTSILPLMVARRTRTRATQLMRAKMVATQSMRARMIATQSVRAKMMAAQLMRTMMKVTKEMGTLVKTEMRSRLSEVVRMVKVAQMKIEHLPSQRGQRQLDSMPNLQQPGSAQDVTT